MTVPLLPILDEAGVRMRPMNRSYPNTRTCTWIGNCPRCHKEDSLFVEQGGQELMTTCCGERGGLVALFRLLVGRVS